MPKLAHMDNIIWRPECEAAELVKALVVLAYPGEDTSLVDNSDWLAELEYAKDVSFTVKSVGSEMVDRSRWSVYEQKAYMVTGYPGQPEGTVCYIAARENSGATEMQESSFSGYEFVRPRLTVTFT